MIPTYSNEYKTLRKLFKKLKVTNLFPRNNHTYNKIDLKKLVLTIENNLMK